MRVTQNITAQTSTYYLQKTLSRMDNIQEKIASGVNTNRPSDDPVMAQLLLSINERLASSDQYKSNISRSQTWYGIADAAMTAMVKTISGISSKITSVTDMLSDDNARQNAISYLDVMKKTLIDMGNTDVGGVYIFAGTKNQSPPFLQSTGQITSGSTVINEVSSVDGLKEGMEISGPGIPPGTTVTKINEATPGGAASLELSNAATADYAVGTSINFYGGNAEDVNIEISKGSTEALNIPGNQLLTAYDGPFGSVNILKEIDSIVAELKKDPASPGYDRAVVTQNMVASMKELNKGTQQLISAETELQSRQVRFDAANNMHNAVTNTYKKILSTQQVADVTTLAVLLNQQQTAYQATLSSTAKLMKMSLLDYM